MANTSVQPKECFGCSIKTKGIWKYKGQMYCYWCYLKLVKPMPKFKL